MTNKEIAELMFSKMRKFGFTPYDIDYGNGYPLRALNVFWKSEE